MTKTTPANDIVRKYIKLGVRFIVKNNVYAEDMVKDINRALVEAYEQGYIAGEGSNDD